jgi:biopolymer transport protein ExbD
MNTNRLAPDVPASSMADIAFLLLTFFMVTTTIADEKGLALLLPEWHETPPIVKRNDRDLFTIVINHTNALLVEGERRESPDRLRDPIKEFLMKHPDPTNAIISIKTDRGASYQMFIQVLDEAEAAYMEMYARQAGISVEAFRSLDPNREADQRLYERGRQGLPKNISLANP